MSCNYEVFDFGKSVQDISERIVSVEERRGAFLENYAMIKRLISSSLDKLQDVVSRIGGTV